MKMPFLSENDDFDSFIAENPEHKLQRLSDGSVLVLTGPDIPSQPVPESVTARQFFFAMEEIGLLESLLTAADQNRMLWVWVHKSEAFNIHHEMVDEMRQQLGKTQADVENLWRLASTKEA